VRDSIACARNGVAIVVINDPAASAVVASRVMLSLAVIVIVVPLEAQCEWMSSIQTVE